MKAHIFSIDDLEKLLLSQERAKKPIDRNIADLRFFDPDFDKNIKVKKNFNYKYNTKQVQVDFNKDINRNPNFCIQTPDGRILNIADEISKKKTDNKKVTYNDVHKYLIDKHNITKDQTEYILTAAYQGSIAGGLTGFGSLIAANIESPEKMANRNGNMSLIKVNPDGNVTYTGGQKVIFDCEMDQYSRDTKGILRNNLHIEFKSKDYISATITANLGKVTDTTFNPKIEIAVAGKGNVGGKIIEQIQAIPSKKPAIQPKIIVESYQNLVSAVMKDSIGRKEFAKEVEKIIKDVVDEKRSESDLKQDLAKIKTYKSTPNYISKVLLERADEEIKKYAIENKKISAEAKKITGENLSKNLQKFIDIDPKEIDKFAKKLISERLEEKNIKIINRNLRGKISSLIKSAWKHQVKNPGQLKVETSAKLEAKIIGENLETISSDRNKSPIRKNLKKHDRSPSASLPSR